MRVIISPLSDISRFTDSMPLNQIGVYALMGVDL